MAKCKDYKRAGHPWQRKEIGSQNRIMTLHFCPVLNDDVHENYGGCHNFVDKNTPQPTSKQNKPRQYFESVSAMLASKKVAA